MYMDKKIDYEVKMSFLLTLGIELHRMIPLDYELYLIFEPLLE